MPVQLYGAAIIGGTKEAQVKRQHSQHCNDIKNKKNLCVHQSTLTKDLQGNRYQPIYQNKKQLDRLKPKASFPSW